MTISINGSGTIAGLVAGGLPDATITQPDLAANVAGKGPAFSYYQSIAQSLSSGVFTKLTFTSSEFDTTGGMYASSRFTPTVAGYYQINGCFGIATTATSLVSSIYKNGVELRRGTVSSSASVAEVVALIYLNGTSDYVEMYGYQVAATQNTAAAATVTYFQGALVRAA